MLRLMVMSATYQQDAKIRPELRDMDPNNRLLARQNPRRLDAEFVRDNALFISGLLDPEVGGPSVYPHQPGGLLRQPAVSRPRLFGKHGHGPVSARDLHALAADVPTSDAGEFRCARARRMHGGPPGVHHAAAGSHAVERSDVCRGRARVRGKILTAPKIKDDAARVNLAIETALLRPAKAAEQESLLKFLGEQRSYYTANPGDAKKLLQAGQRPPPLH